MLSILFDQVLAKEVDLPINYLDGLQRVCEEDKYAFMAMDNTASELQRKLPCRLEHLDTITQTSIAMATSTRNPYRGIINNNILMLRDSGILQRMLNTEWSTRFTKVTLYFLVCYIVQVKEPSLIQHATTFFSRKPLGRPSS